MSDLKMGTDFGGYKLQSKLGKGGMGNVYKALDVGFDRVLAIKITEALEYVSEDDIRRFEAEAHAMKNLEHQNITPVYNYGIVNDRQYIAMKFVQGMTLAEVLNKKRPDISTLIDYTKQISRALLYAHQHNIVHRDVKPSNIMVQPDGHLYLGDFGISYALKQERLTKVGMAMGTPEYMSPEQCQGLKIDTRTDIYAFGVILYELITGLPPFTGDKPLAIAYKHVHEEVQYPTKITDKVPTKILELIEACLQKEPSARPQKMSIVLDQLDQVDLKVVPKKIKPLKSKTSTTTTTIKNLGKSQSPSLKLFLLAFILILGVNLYLITQNTPNNNSPFINEFKFMTPKANQHRSHDSLQYFEWTHRATKGHLRINIILPKETLITGLGMKWSRANTTAPPPGRIFIEGHEGESRLLKPKNVNYLQFFSFDPMLVNNFEIQLPTSERFKANPHILSDLKIIGSPFNKK